MSKRRKRPKLKPLKLTDEELEVMATVTEEDIVKAGAEWQEHAENTELLESTPEIEDDADGS